MRSNANSSCSLGASHCCRPFANLIDLLLLNCLQGFSQNPDDPTRFFQQPDQGNSVRQILFDSSGHHYACAQRLMLPCVHAGLDTRSPCPGYSVFSLSVFHPDGVAQQMMQIQGCRAACEVIVVLQWI